MATPNDDLLGKVSSTGSVNDPRELYEAAHGRYDDLACAFQSKRALTQAPSTKQPLRLSGGK